MNLISTVNQDYFPPRDSNSSRTLDERGNLLSDVAPVIAAKCAS